MKKKTVFLFVMIVYFSILPITMVSAAYSDVPENSWASESITSATEYGFISGIGSGRFGYGKEISRAEFVTAICKMFEWAIVSPGNPAFEDVASSSWYFPYVETALVHNVIDNSGNFLPESSITREDMVVMLVRALGYASLAAEASKYTIPFEDVTTNKGYINVANDIGITSGTSPVTFSPHSTAKREEAAAMLVRIYEKYIRETEFLHGFYAFSSYSQHYVAEYMDTVSFGWSNMCYDAENGVWLNTGKSDGNQWAVPDGYDSIVSYLETVGTEAHLNVFMDASKTITYSDGTTGSSIKGLLLSDEARKEAVAVIVSELERTYSSIGKNPYSGVTIDFEGLKGEELKAGFTAFLTLLSQELKSRGLGLFVAVHPAVPDGVYFDGYDYRAIGKLADKVILMAHDYNTTSLDGFIGTEWHKTTALTPIASVYYSLRAVTDKETGVEDRSKLVMAISFSTIGWEITEDGKVKSGNSYSPALSTVYKRLLQDDTVIGWSAQYKNPYMSYYTESRQKIFLWFEDAESINAKITLAKLFGITGVSVWRIGIIPDYSGVYDVWSELMP